ncbi:MAG: hypothetical protein BGO90_06515 [Legionella sp. 40-6]|nr:hypothetical protein [Legionella sp.]OJX98930.1 MAG: hypothetical protein BGO90_06515 [Legionella sp. 40-6]
MFGKTEKVAKLSRTQLANKKFDYYLGHQFFLDATPLMNALSDNQAESLYIEYSSYDFNRTSAVLNLSYVIVDALKQNTSLTTLILKDSDIAHSLADVVTSLVHHPSIQTLDLRVYGPRDLTPALVKSLANLLEQNQSLVNLESRYLNFGNTDIAELAEALAQSTRLRRLSLNGWKLSPENKQKLYAALEANNSLNEIECSENYVGSDQELALEIEKIKKSKEGFSSNFIPVKENHRVEFVDCKIRKPKPPKCIIFDRDNTLIDQNNQIINPGKMVSMIKAIAEASQCKMGIASLERVTKESDRAILAFHATGVMTKNTEIALAEYGKPTLAHSLADSMIDVAGIEYDEENSILRARNSFFAAEIQIPESTPGRVEKTDDFGDWNLVSGTKNKRPIKINPETVWTAKIGQTLIKIRGKEFFENYSYYVDSDCKIAAVFQILDQHKLKLKATPELCALGFINITTPSNYKEITANDLVILDSKTSICSYLRSAGMTTIHVNTDGIYVSQLQSVLPTEVKEKYLSLLGEDKKRQELIDDLQRYMNRINPDKTSNLSEINFQAGFCFFKQSQAINRKANYRLALHLLNKLTNRNNPIESIFKEREMNQLRRNFGATRKINSDELNDVIKKEQAWGLII